MPLDDRGMAQIHRMIEDPDSDPSEAARLITLEIATVSGDLVRRRNDPMMAWRLKADAQAIKSLRELRHSLMDREVLSRKEVLNLDGEKAQFLIHRLLAWFNQAMKQAGVEEETRNNIFRQYRDIATVGEPELRREIQKISSNLPRR